MSTFNPDRTSAFNQRLADQYFENHKDRIYSPPLNKYVVIGGNVEEVKTVVVHEFTISDVEDPDIYAADPLIAWERSDSGRWVMEHAAEPPTWHRMRDAQSYGHRYRITAKLVGSGLTEWLLRYGEKWANPYQ